MSLSMMVKPTPGSHVRTAIEDACRLAEKLEMDWINFEFNDSEMTCYPDGRALELHSNSLVRHWRRYGLESQDSGRSDWESEEAWIIRMDKERGKS